MLAAAASADSTWELPASDPSALSWLKSPPADLSSPLLVTPPRRERARQASLLPPNALTICLFTLTQTLPV